MAEEVRLQKMLHDIQIKMQMVDAEKGNTEMIEHWQLEEDLTNHPCQKRK